MLRLAGCGLVALLLCAASAEASTLSGTHVFSTRPASFVIYNYEAGPGEQTKLTITDNVVPGHTLFEDRGALITSYPLPQRDQGALVGVGLLCVPGLLLADCYSSAPLVAISVTLGDGGSTGSVSASRGAGDDFGMSVLWSGGSGDDTITLGSEYDDVTCGAGDDTVTGVDAIDVVAADCEHVT